jgi:hypothetical protein
VGAFSDGEEVFEVGVLLHAVTHGGSFVFVVVSGAGSCPFLGCGGPDGDVAGHEESAEDGFYLKVKILTTVALAEASGLDFDHHAINTSEVFKHFLLEKDHSGKHIVSVITLQVMYL